jgi:hypothetical protein
MIKATPTRIRREREKVGLTLKMRLLLVDSHAKPPLKSIVQTNTKTSREIPSACTTKVNGRAGTRKAIASLSSLLLLLLVLVVEGNKWICGSLFYVFFWLRRQSSLLPVI